MAIFGRMTARQRLRRATRESLAMPAFSSPIDCTPWVIGGVWPAELSTITAENARLAEYLKADLQRIADSANEQLKIIKRAGLADLPRQAEEARIIDEARACAVRRVESTIRQLHAELAGATAGYSRRQFAAPPSPEGDETRVIPAVTDAGPLPHAPDTGVRRPRWRVADKPAPVVPRDGGEQPEPAAHDAAVPEIAAPPAAAPDLEETQVIPSVTEVEPVANGRHHAEAEQPAESEPVPDTHTDDDQSALMEETQIIPAITESAPVVEEAHAPVDAAGDLGAASLEETQVIPAITEVEPVVDQTAPEQDEAPPAPQPEPVAAVSLEETQVIPAITEVEPVVDEPAAAAAGPGWGQADSGRHHAVADEPAAQYEPARSAAAIPRRDEKTSAATSLETDRLNRLLEFVVRQESRLNWAVGDLPDGTTVLVTDLAHGWIPAGINLPAGVRLLEPEQRTGRVSALIDGAARMVTYSPGDSLRRSVDFTATRSSLEPRELRPIGDLARVLSETTRRFDGLPRIVQRLADAAAADAMIIDQEVDVLRVHLDTARYQLLVQYPAVNPALLLKCMLMAATEGIASGDRVSANYHLAWYQKLATPPPDS
ncbi:hypothetical protein A5674_25080 [Mycobacterium malmoense]|uniref:DUF5631 domain-containing protein n=1 Tax=Mycobacterium malmoense TaxID=1780 RepID=UPI00080B19DE|nr:DUF5631 domain-containing protein [Mycobacterium malmoense]OCB22854.1 hypothetical protein A5674_25080 [Mycobacterium malmoense]